MSDRRGPSASFVLRELRWEDFPARVEAYLSLYDEVKENEDLGMTLMEAPPTEAEEAAWFGELYQRVRRGEVLVVIGEIEGRAVGSVTIEGPRFGGRRSEASHVGILGVLVDRRYRGRGLGRAMMVRALELARGRFERIRLAVFSVNVRAKRLYEQLGFHTVGRLEGEVKRGDRYLDVELMTLNLKDWRPPGHGSDP